MRYTIGNLDGGRVKLRRTFTQQSVSQSASQPVSLAEIAPNIFFFISIFISTATRLFMCIQNIPKMYLSDPLVTGQCVMSRFRGSSEAGLPRLSSENSKTNISAQPYLFVVKSPVGHGPRKG